ncbi:FAD-dependent oxidoreductase [Leucobacter sp. cx-42]|uniref:FAD-dependent oxidoreductase n=1 Tax=unclassified Leucobacter TaxID=2621730 RepID=UPI00165D5C43|nr:MULTISPECIES: FAD-dependent oxidoreductase [unclassified Leucobacter]MBC9953117.1 FAD-dependent oxidoreductase [Leucobacter sp. cx-42]
MSSPANLHIAIIGAGPSGCYLAQALSRGLPESTITIFDRLASPFGLIRYGVAADHQHTKAITRQFERLFASGAARFAGDIEVGRDLSLADLQANFDAVVLASGLTIDRQLDIPGAELPGVLGAGEITRALNSHPASAALRPDFGTEVVIIGAGNVALDILRFLVKDAAGYDASDVNDAYLNAYLSAPAQRVTLASRSRTAESKGDPQMIKELATLPRAHYSSTTATAAAPDADRTATARSAAFADLFSPDRAPAPGPEVHVLFGATPTRILGADHVTGVEFALGSETTVVPATSVITAVGFAPDADDALSALTATPAASGRLAAGLYRTGWAKRGPNGAIPENRACAKSVADEMLADIESGALAPAGKTGFAGLPDTVRERAVSYDDWLRLDAHERNTALANRVRNKLPDHTYMVKIARG